MSKNDPVKLTFKDPICGMSVTDQSLHVFNYKSKPVYFCSAGCRTKFVADPAKYLVSDSSSDNAIFETKSTPSEPAPTGTIFTCPMHPEVRQTHAGVCPKCGMALEAEMPSLDDSESPELLDFKRRFVWTLPLTIIVTLLAMVGHRLQWFEMATQSWIELFLSLPIVLWAGWPFFERGIQSINNRSPNMWTLIGLGTSAAFIYSVVATVCNGLVFCDT